MTDLTRPSRLADLTGDPDADEAFESCDDLVFDTEPPAEVPQPENPDHLVEYARVTPRLRFEILRRDGHRCHYCGASGDDVELHVDHVVPVALGGPTVPANLVAACQPCNAGKASTAPDGGVQAAVAADAALWQLARERVIAQPRRPNLYRGFDDECQQFYAAWDRWRFDDDGGSVPMPEDWRQSVRSWLLRGYPIDLVCEAIPVAMKKQGINNSDHRWRYLCAVVWKQIARFEQEVEEEFGALRAEFT